MKTVLKARWLVIAAWVVAVAALVWASPDMGELVREKGQITVPEGYSSSIAEEILEEAMSDGSQVALVFHEETGLDDEDLAHIQNAIQQLKKNQEALGITSITTHFDEAELKDQFVAEDGKTILVALDVETGDRDRLDVRDRLYEAIHETPVAHYYTGSWMIEEDVVVSAQEGLNRTLGITIIFILVVLVVVFRSLVAPIIPLVTVGVSYIASESIVAFLVDGVNFPLSTFTQIFLVAVLFGIGTDYCILLLSRFKEEVANQGALFPAIVETYRTAGKTVFYSALAVMVGFGAIGLSTFKLYQSAAAVAIGVAILLLALFSIVPFFMALFGKRLFWPSKRALEHRENELWGKAGKFSLARPFVTLLFIALIVTPFLLTYNGDLSYNSLDEIGDSYDSVKAFNIISDSFGPGESLPAKIVIKHDSPWDTSAGLAAIEKISREVEKVDGIESVRSATRPTGDELEELKVAHQAEVLDEGLEEGNQGLAQIRDGLQEASTSLAEAAPEMEQATDGIDDLIAGTLELKSGVIQLGDGLKQLERGLRDGTVGAGELKDGLAEAKRSAEQLAAGGRELLRGYREAEAGLGKLLDGYQKIEEGLSQLSQLPGALGRVSQLMEQAAGKPGNEGLATEEFWIAFGMIQELQAQTDEISRMAQGMQQLNAGLAATLEGLQEANAGLTEVVDGQTALSGGFDELVNGLSALQDGIEQAADGQRDIHSQLAPFTTGLEQITGGQRELRAGFAEMDDQLAVLTDGLDESAQGLQEISSGLNSARDYLSDLSSTAKDDLSGWFIPDDVLQNDDFSQLFDVYMSDDRHVTTLDVVFNANPYSTQAMDKVDEIEEAVQRGVKETDMADATVAVSGVSSMNHDLSTISDQDYTRTVILMLVSIALILIVLFRSAVMPLYLIASLILTYFTSLGIAEFVFVDLMGYPGLSWATPFFGFVILIALGVDYSIFLMDRFNEYKGGDIREGLLTTMRKMGTVIISAVIILGGTFAAMYPSGVLSLLQIATVTISGLVLYACLFLPFFVPVMVRLFGEANWWPFNQQR